MKIKLTKPSNQFWAILISTVILIVMFFGIDRLGYYLLGSEDQEGLAWLIFSSPLSFIISLRICYLFVYPKIDKYLDHTYKNNSHRKLRIKLKSIILGTILGLITEMILGLITRKNYNLSLEIFLCIVWVKIVDKMINK